MTYPHPLLYRARNKILICCIAFWAAAFVATHIPPPKTLPFHASDKVLHAAGYFLLGGLLLVSMVARRTRRAHRIAFVICSMSLYGGFDEITQELVKRTASIGDWIADLIGTVVAVIAIEIALLLLKKRSRRGAEPQSK